MPSIRKLYRLPTIAILFIFKYIGMISIEQIGIEDIDIVLQYR